MLAVIEKLSSEKRAALEGLSHIMAKIHVICLMFQETLKSSISKQNDSS